ncbi:MAG TPA: hypothetical protein VF744_04180 [Beijerinckiaceae bacterium]|jgi:uncharacterized protein YwgA
MSELPKAVAEITALNGGTLIGKTRLQKTAYLLESKGAGYGFDFEYHYYGPYSEDLSIAAEDGEALGLLSAKENLSAAGLPYVVYNSAASVDPGSSNLMARRAAIVATLKPYDSIALELAATAEFLSKNGFSEDPWMETRRRKAGKATPEAVARAKKLLRELEAI